MIVLSGDAQKHGCTGYLDEKEEFVENVVRSHELDVTLKLRLDVLKDWLDRVAVRVSWFTQQQHTTRQTTDSQTKLAATLRWFTAGGAIRIALRQLFQNRK